MISLNKFYATYEAFRKYGPNTEQRQAIEQAADKNLFIVAGPGTGKTTCLTLRILKLILVDGLPPKSILATTFTKKAAAELRSRVLGWGFNLLEQLHQDKTLPPATQQWLATVDINQVTTGTIDSICEQMLRLFRDPGTQPPVLVDEFVTKTLMLRHGLFENRRDQDPDLHALLHEIHGDSDYGFHIGRKVDYLQNLWERRFQDQVDWNDFVKQGPASQKKARQLVDEATQAYEKALAEQGFVDFSLLEQEVLRRLRQKQLAEFTQDLKVILVDEYQDTNLLQEGLYFELAKICGGALNVVGDDDQSLYRFRGATVELFSDFEARSKKALRRKAEKVFLTTNYRSTKATVDFVKRYAQLDKAYQAVRVKDKPELQAGPKASVGLPVLGMFRDDLDTLAKDLARFIYQVFRGTGYKLPSGETIRASTKGGDLGDCTLLCSSPAEYNASNKPRLPRHLREELLAQETAINVFNPRGQELTVLPLIQNFGGLLLECLDPGDIVATLAGKGLTDDTLNTFNAWRAAAVSFAESSQAPKGMLKYAQGWAYRDPQQTGKQWPHNVSALDLIYGLAHFFPELHNDPEGQVYLEVFTRQLSACEQVGKFGGRVVTDDVNPGLAEASVIELLRDFLGPIASGTVKVNEELMEAFPRNRLSLLSIHQSKGLEFPLTIVDIGSDFKTNHPTHAFKRYPKNGGAPHRLEDMMRPHTPLGAPSRSTLDRAFDDLSRQFFVAYSRPQDVLLLIGLRKIYPDFVIKHIAAGWNRNDQSLWAKNKPLLEI